MAARIKYDMRAPARVRNTRTGIEIVRGVQVLDIPIAAGASDPSVLLKCIKLVGSGPGDTVNRFPQMFDTFPDADVASAIVDEQNLVSVDRVNDIVNAEVIYRSPTFGPISETVDFVVTDDFQISNIQTFATADGSRTLSAWYQKMFDPTANYPGTTAPGTSGTFPDQRFTVKKPTSARKLTPFRVIKAVGTATQVQWNAIKANIRAAAGKINSDTWGGDPRGKWYFVGPRTTIPSNGSGRVQAELTFLGALGNSRHFAVLPYFDEHGEHPGDSATEAQVLATGYPAEGNMNRNNGLTIASIFYETAFTGLFNFSPA